MKSDLSSLLLPNPLQPNRQTQKDSPIPTPLAETRTRLSAESSEYSPTFPWVLKTVVTTSSTSESVEPSAFSRFCHFSGSYSIARVKPQSTAFRGNQGQTPATR